MLDGCKCICVVVSIRSRSGAGRSGAEDCDFVAGPKAVVAPVWDPGLFEFLQNLLRRIKELVRLRPEIWPEFARLFGGGDDAKSE